LRLGSLADPLYVAYHDEEWGVPERDESALFELLNLEGAQAGSPGRRSCTSGRVPTAFAGWTSRRSRLRERDVERLLGDAGIVRHRGKIEAVIGTPARRWRSTYRSASCSGRLSAASRV
jgi:DNA-3-methyladenine glycosylase I